MKFKTIILDKVLHDGDELTYVNRRWREDTLLLTVKRYVFCNSTEAPPERLILTVPDE